MARTSTRLPGPRGLPLLGNLLSLDVEDLHRVVEDWADQYGELFELRLGRRRCLVLGRTDLIQDVLRRRPHDFRRVAKLAPIINELGGRGVFTAEGDDWKRQRRLVMPAFGRKAIEAVMPVLKLVTERLVARLDAQGEAPRDVHADLLRFTTDVTTLMAFGHDLNTLEHGDALHAHLRELLPAIMRRFNAPVPYWRFWPVPAELAANRASHAVKQVLLDIIRDRESRNEPGSTLLDRLIEARDDADPARLSDDELVGNVLTILLAGEDTTGSALAWLLYYAALHPEVWLRLREESEAVFGDDSPKELAELARLPYLSAVFKETLRLRSPAPVLIHEAVRDLEVAGVRLGRGDLVMLLTRRVGLTARDLDGPRSFRPERWLAGGELDPANGAAAELLLAFGSGPRLCPGRTMSEVEAKVVISALCRRFVPRLPQGATAVGERFAFTMEPVGLQLAMHKWSNARDSCSVDAEAT